MRESRIEKALREGVEALGGSCEKFVSPGRVGVPDRLVCWPKDSDQAHDLLQGYTNGRLPAAEFVETKAPGGELESWQHRDHERRRDMGFEVHVLWNLEQVEAYLRSRGKK